MNDKILRQNIIDALDFEPSIDSAEIGVAVDNGVVTLTGHVPTYAQKSSAERVVMRVKAVKGVAEEIEVRPYGSHRSSDDEIAKRAVSALTWNTSVPTDAVKVRVEKGFVTLTGTVEWQYQKNAAAAAIRNLPDILGISNQVELAPRVKVADVKQRIENALKRDAILEADAIRVEVDHGAVTLAGRVKAWSERQAAERAAWSAPGVTRVEDRITVHS